jgi:hypothetical protein
MYPDLVTRDKPQHKCPVFSDSKVGLAAVGLKTKTPPLQNKTQLQNEDPTIYEDPTTTKQSLNAQKDPLLQSKNPTK